MEKSKYLAKTASFILASLVFLGCASGTYNKTVEKLEIDRFMGKWYVLAGRFTFLEKEVHNSVEIYTWNQTKNRIEIDFTYNRGSLNGELKSIPQNAQIYNKKTNAHWKVSPFWPLKFDYLVIDLAEDYSWTAIGVPDQDYLWIMARSPAKAEQIIETALKRLKEKKYNIENIVKVPHN